MDTKLNKFLICLIVKIVYFGVRKNVFGPKICFVLLKKASISLEND